MKNIFILFLIFISINITNAMEITEIMFDPEGSDSGREWIEIFNNSGESINISDLKLFENDTNHGITGENTQINGGEYVVLADNPPKFLIDFPNFSGILLDSAFSLLNTGEYLAIKLKTGEILDELTYDTSIGGNGSGNSIQKTSSGSWIPANSTPGKVNNQNAANEKEEEEVNEQNNTSNSDSSHAEQEEITEYEPSIDLKIGIGRDRLVSVNSPVEFELKSNKKLYSLNIEWNFGDGSEVESGIKAKHVYEYTGSFAVLVTASSKERNKEGFIEKVVTRGNIDVYEPELELVLATSSKYILNAVIKNNTGKEVNIGEWGINWGKRVYKIPRNTIILSNQSIQIPLKDINFLDLNRFEGIDLLYPNSYWYNSFKWMH